MSIPLLRRLVVVLFLLAFFGFLLLINQKALAMPFAVATDLATDTLTYTATISAPATLTQTATLTYPATINSTATATSTTNQTSTLTATFVASPTATLSVTLPIIRTSTLTPTAIVTQASLRDVVINEIAWMGTFSNSDSEWIELYNPGNTDIDISGWLLRSSTGPFEISLVGKIPKKGYFLLGRKTSLVDTKGPFINITPDQLYYMSSTLDDYGDYLLLKDYTGKTIDTANSRMGSWLAGDRYRKCSMERGGDDLPDKQGSWLTNIGVVRNGRDQGNNAICGTPGQKNWGYTVIPTPTFTPTLTLRPSRTNTPYRPYRTPTRTSTPKRSPTPTINPYATPISSVVINEILVQPRFDWNGDGEVNSGDEYIEIINLGKKAAPLAGWSLDDQAGDSTAYLFEGSAVIQPQAIMTFFNTKTGLLLSPGGDSVRLFRPGNLLTDAFSYKYNPVQDQSWCRLPDGTGLWQFGCGPTVDQKNKKAQAIIIGNRLESVVCLLKDFPLGVQQAECDPLGLSAWNSDLWSPPPAFPRYIEDGSTLYILD